MMCSLDILWVTDTDVSFLYVTPHRLRDFCISLSVRSKFILLLRCWIKLFWNELCDLLDAKLFPNIVAECLIYTN